MAIQPNKTTEQAPHNIPQIFELDQIRKTCPKCGKVGTEKRSHGRNTGVLYYSCDYIGCCHEWSNNTPIQFQYKVGDEFEGDVISFVEWREDLQMYQIGLEWHKTVLLNSGYWRYYFKNHTNENTKANQV